MVLHLSSPNAACAWLRERLGGLAGRLCIDSREVAPGDGFIAWPGAATDGRQHVASALAAGARACLVEAEGLAAYALDPADARIAAYRGLKAATGPIAAQWFGHPGRALDIVAVTATNGKSSTAWWTAQALAALGRRCGVVGTLGIGEPPPAGAAAGAGSTVATGLTTPDPLRLHAALRSMVDKGLQACAIEASSIGLAEHRLAGLPIRVAQFINFTRDHLDYHGSMAAYWTAKRQLFDWPGLAAAVVDVDDPQGRVLADELATGRIEGSDGTGGAEPAVAAHARTSRLAASADRPLAALDLWRCSRQDPTARLCAEAVRHGARGLSFQVIEQLPGASVARATVDTALVGEHNVHNLLAVLGALRALGLPLQAAASVLAGLTPVPGRMQPVPRPADLAGPEVVVDYAHTPDALEKALAALQPMTISRGGRLWCVFGCGGNRDASKRPMMGAIAQRMADRVVLTSDNPRNEDPSRILADIRSGIDAKAALTVMEDRAEAIAHAVAEAAPQDVVLLAGKGHEDYQEVAGQRRPFLDLAVASQALAARLGMATAPGVAR